MTAPLILPDSSVWIDFLGGRENTQTLLLRATLVHRTAVVVIGDLILFEVLSGARTVSQRRALDAVFGPLTEITLSDPVAARRAAERYRALRGGGITIRKSVDVLIASWCIDNDVALLHRDRDFEPFTEAFGLKTL